MKTILSVPAVLFIAALVVFAFIRTSSADVYFSGWVKDSAGTPVSSASVTMPGESFSVVTKTDGSFELRGVPTGISQQKAARHPAAQLQVSGSRISLRLPASTRKASMTMYDIRGRKFASAAQHGSECKISLPLSSGVFILRIKTFGVMRSIPVTLINGRVPFLKTITLPLSETETASGISPTAQAILSGGGYRLVSASKPSYFTSYSCPVSDTVSNLLITILDSSRYSSFEAWRNPALPVDARVADLVSRMTIEERVAQLIHEAPAVKRLGIIEYNWWNECLHGVGLAYLATVFPQATGMAATWDTALIKRVTTVISDEARAKYRRETEEYGKVRQMRGLTFFSPNINILRDPRWGRAQETYGEDPYLTSRIAVSFLKGLHGDDPKYLKASGTAKHYAVHSGPESLRHVFNAEPSWRDFWDTYMPAFRACIKEADVRSVMCAYNKIGGTYACRDDGLLNGILRREWGFDGFVVSDCGAPVSLAAGCDLICAAGWDWQDTFSTKDYHYLIDTAVTRCMKVRFELGMFDPQQIVPYASIPYSVVDCEKHRRVARETAQKSIVLLKNHGVLPISSKVKKILVAGPHSDWEQVMWGNYYGTPSYTITPLEGILAQAGSGASVFHANGCNLVDSVQGGFAAAESLARVCDIVIACCGLSSESGGFPLLENENQDRESIGLPEIQNTFIRKLAATGKPVILVLINGGPVTVNYADSAVSAIVEAWYGGQEAGRALADVLFGEVNPGGRLPFTVYKSESDIPDITDYEMEHGRTYQFFKDEPLYPFGYGLSYTTFEYSNLNVNTFTGSTDADTVIVSVTVTNTGARSGDEVAQLYISTPAAGGADPARALKGFSRVNLKTGESRNIDFTLTSRDLSRISESGTRVFEPGRYLIYAGGGQPYSKGASQVLEGDMYFDGAPRELGL